MTTNARELRAIVTLAHRMVEEWRDGGAEDSAAVAALAALAQDYEGYIRDCPDDVDPLGWVVGDFRELAERIAVDMALEEDDACLYVETEDEDDTSLLCQTDDEAVYGHACVRDQRGIATMIALSAPAPDELAAILDALYKRVPDTYCATVAWRI